MQSIKFPREKIKKILVIKMRYIGDTVLVTPLLRALKTAMPAAETFLLLNKEAAPVITGHPHINRLLSFDDQRAKKDLAYFIQFVLQIRKLKLDMVIDLTQNDRSALFTFFTGAAYRIGFDGASAFQRRAYTHRVPYLFGKIHTVDHHLMMAKHLGLPPVDSNPDLPVFPEDIQWVRNRLASAGVENSLPYVLIHPGARRWYKSWPIDRFSQLADRIYQRYRVQVVLSGGPSDRETCEKIASKTTRRIFDLSGQIPLAQLPALIQKSVLLIGNDSAPIHIATAVNTPVIALFGPTRWEDWHPRRDHDKTLSVSFPCRPCGHSNPDCPMGDAYCMSEISTTSVWTAVQERLLASGVDSHHAV
ncbi:MAG: putative lipopolysaccharide heptosyltransferase III [Desulfobacterales bacterium]|jgi:predicted lipopolysaccharide heptosyltransferase III|nr:putative lipopolysaccharide heptosyltransferase III [Desulfobacterales bacterium]